jgi:hypothetical protein
MNSTRRVFFVALAVLSGIALAAGDAKRGEEKHRSCLQCHGTDIYNPSRAGISTLKALRAETVEWCGVYNPPCTKQEVEDLVEYLNRSFYRLER